MDIDRIDRLVFVCFAAMLLAVLGMIFDVWRLVYYAVPVLSALLMFMGALDARDRWSAPVLVRVGGFGALLLASFAVADVLLRVDAMVGGLPAATGVFFYVIWPLTAVGSPLLFASIFQTWLRRDLDS